MSQFRQEFEMKHWWFLCEIGVHDFSKWIKKQDDIQIESGIAMIMERTCSACGMIQRRIVKAEIE